MQILLWSLQLADKRGPPVNEVPIIAPQDSSSRKSKKKGKGKRKPKSKDASMVVTEAPSAPDQLGVPLGDGHGGEVVWSQHHKLKPNWISSLFISSPVIMVADPSADISLYDVL